MIPNIFDAFIIMIVIITIIVIVLDDFNIILRFGKLGVVWSGSKCVDIEINGKEVDFIIVIVIVIVIVMR